MGAVRAAAGRGRLIIFRNIGLFLAPIFWKFRQLAEAMQIQNAPEASMHHLKITRAIAIILLTAAVTTVPQRSNAQSVDWFTVDSGGGTSTGGNYSVSGTIAQVDADPLHPASGGNFELTGGFWVIDSAPPTTQDAIFRDGFE
jgi:hypothetical protein